MSTSISKKLLSIAAVVVAVTITMAGTFLLVVWTRDVLRDRQHAVRINAETPVFAGTGEEGGCEGTPLTTLSRGVQLPVRRIRYQKSCATIDIQLPDGRKGNVILGVGDVSVNPPLPSEISK